MPKRIPERGNDPDGRGRTSGAEEAAAAAAARAAFKRDLSRVMQMHNERQRHTRQVLDVLCWNTTGKATPLGDQVAIEMSLGAPPHGGVGRVHRLLAMALRVAVGSITRSSPEYPTLVSAVGGRSWLLLEDVLANVVRDRVAGARLRLCAALCLVLRAQIQDEEGGTPAPGSRPHTPLRVLDLALEAGDVPAPIVPLVESVLGRGEVLSADAVLAEGLILLKHGYLPGSPRKRTAHGQTQGRTARGRALDSKCNPGEVGVLPGARGLLALGGEKLVYSKGRQGFVGFAWDSKQGKLLIDLVMKRRPVVRSATIAGHVSSALERVSNGVVSIVKRDGARALSHELTLSADLKSRLSE